MLAAAVVVLALATSVVAASAQPQAAELGRMAADGALRLASDRPGVALLQAEGMRPGASVTGTVALSNDGGSTGALTLGVAGVSDQPGAFGGRLSQALRVRVQDVDGTMAPLERVVDQAGAFALGNLAAGATRSYRVTAILPVSGDNTLQGSRVSLDLEWRLTTPDPPVPTPTPAPPAPIPAPPASEVLPGSASAPGRKALVRLRVPKQRVLGTRGITAFAECEVACSLRFTARVDSAPRRGRRRTLQGRGVFRDERRWRAVTAGREQRVFLKLSSKSRKLLKRRLHVAGRVGITVTAHMRSAAGNQSARRRIVPRTYKRAERR